MPLIPLCAGDLHTSLPHDLDLDLVTILRDDKTCLAPLRHCFLGLGSKSKMICFTALPLRGIALLLIVLACYVVLTPVCAVQTAESQVQAMMQASQQTGFGWNIEQLRGACESGYAGVRSCNENGFVSSLYLDEDITAVAPPAFSGLTALKSLKLIYPLNGTLPSSWSSLAQLETLVLRDYFMQLTGALPASWYAMTKLNSLEVGFADNRDPASLIASSPPWWLANVESVYITSAYWPNATIPDSIGISTTLKSLRLIDCVFAGGFPSGLLTNTHIESIHLHCDPSTTFGAGYTFPSDFSGMTSLRYLRLDGNSFKGSLPTTLPPNLLFLQLNHMQNITGTIPQSLLDHPTVNHIDIGEAMYGVSGTVPVPSNPMTSDLSGYALSGMSLTGTIPSSILGLYAYIILDNLPKLSGPFPTVTSSSASSCLTWHLYISNINLTGTQLPIGLLENCDRLESAWFTNSGLTGQIPDVMCAESLKSLNFDSNAFGGSLPIINFASTEANRFTCNNCNLTGVVPPDYLNNPALRTFELAGNRLDLCSNRAAINETGFVNKSTYSCNLVGQTPRECGCPEIWPRSCFSSRPMAPDCDNLPPDTLAPPPSKPSNPSNLPPIAASSAFIPSIALIATMLVFNFL